MGGPASGYVTVGEFSKVAVSLWLVVVLPDMNLQILCRS